MVRHSRMTDARIDSFEMLWSHLNSLYKDVESLSKRKQDGLMSKTRVATINQILGEIKTLLKDHPSAGFLTLLDDATLPQNADALIFLGQYKSAMQNFVRTNTDNDLGTRRWKGTDREFGRD